MMNIIQYLAQKASISGNISGLDCRVSTRAIGPGVESLLTGNHHHELCGGGGVLRV